MICPKVCTIHSLLHSDGMCSWSLQRDNRIQIIIALVFGLILGGHRWYKSADEVCYFCSDKGSLSVISRSFMSCGSLDSLPTRCVLMMKSKKISNDQELIQSDPISCPQNQKGNN